MTTYVDQPIFTKGAQKFCHMWSDSTEEMHTFAKGAGIHRCWYHSPYSRKKRSSWHHYDLNPTNRAKALAHGAKEVDSREAVRRKRGRIL